MIKNKLFKTDERIRMIYNRIGSTGFHILSLLIWLNLIYRIIFLNQRGKEIFDIVIILIFVGFYYIFMAAYFIREAIMNKSKEKISRLSIVSLIAGIISITLYWICGVFGIPGPLDIITFWISIVSGFVAIICGGIDLYRIKINKSSLKNKGFDVSGITVGAIGTIFILAFSFYLVFSNST